MKDAFTTNSSFLKNKAIKPQRKVLVVISTLAITFAIMCGLVTGNFYSMWAVEKEYQKLEVIMRSLQSSVKIQITEEGSLELINVFDTIISNYNEQLNLMDLNHFNIGLAVLNDRFEAVYSTSSDAFNFDKPDEIKELAVNPGYHEIDRMLVLIQTCNRPCGLIVTYSDKDIIDQSLQQNTMRVTTGSIAAVVITAALFLLFIYFIVIRRLNRLTKEVILAPDNNYLYNNVIKGNDELNALSNAFEDLCRRVNTELKSLNENLSDVEKELKYYQVSLSVTKKIQSYLRYNLHQEVLEPLRAIHSYLSLADSGKALKTEKYIKNSLRIINDLDSTVSILVRVHTATVRNDSSVAMENLIEYKPIDEKKEVALSDYASLTPRLEMMLRDKLRSTDIYHNVEVNLRNTTNIYTDIEIISNVMSMLMSVVIHYTKMGHIKLSVSNSKISNTEGYILFVIEATTKINTMAVRKLEDPNLILDYSEIAKANDQVLAEFTVEVANILAKNIDGEITIKYNTRPTTIITYKQPVAYKKALRKYEMPTVQAPIISSKIISYKIVSEQRAIIKDMLEYMKIDQDIAETKQELKLLLLKDSYGAILVNYRTLKEDTVPFFRNLLESADAINIKIIVLIEDYTDGISLNSHGLDISYLIESLDYENIGHLLKTIM